METKRSCGSWFNSRVMFFGVYAHHRMQPWVMLDTICLYLFQSRLHLFVQVQFMLILVILFRLLRDLLIMSSIVSAVPLPGSYTCRWYLVDICKMVRQIGWELSDQSRIFLATMPNHPCHELSDMLPQLSQMCAGIVFCCTSHIYCKFEGGSAPCTKDDQAVGVDVRDCTFDATWRDLDPAVGRQKPTKLWYRCVNEHNRRTRCCMHITVW